MATNEATLNTIIKNSFYRASWGEKLADPAGGKGTQRAFDGIATLLGLPIYYETKILKEYKAFNFNLIEKHQRYNLLRIDSELKVENLTLILLGVWIQRKSFRLFVFDAPSLFKKQDSGIKSIKKKELEQLVSDNMYLNIMSEKDKIDSKKRKQFIQDIHLLKEKIIY